MQSLDTITNICKNWIGSSHVPDYLRAPEGKMYCFNLVYEYVLKNLQGKFNYDNLNRALDRLIKAARIPAHKGQKQNPETGLWYDQPSAEKRAAKEHQRELAHMGVSKTNKPNHADEPAKGEETVDARMHKIAKQIFSDEPYNPPPKPKAVLQNIPLDTPASELTKYSAEEIKVYLRRKKEQERQEQFGM
jgi:hypothetical protein